MASIQRQTFAAQERRIPLYRQQQTLELDTLPSVLLTDDLRILACNQAFCDWLGLPEQALPSGIGLSGLPGASSRLLLLLEHIASPIRRFQSNQTFIVQPWLNGAFVVHVCTKANPSSTRPTADGGSYLTLAQASVGVWEFDPGATRYHCAPSWWSWLGYACDSDACYESLVHPDDLDQVRLQRGRCLRKEQPQFACELRVKAACGGWRWVLSRGRLIEMAGRPRLMGVDIDISDLKSAAQQQQLFACVVNVIPLGVMVSDVNGRIQMVNAAFTQITGYQADEVLGQSADLLNSGIHHAVFYQHMWSAVSKCGTWSGEVWNRRKNGDIYPEWMTLICLRDNQARITHYAAVFEDITERKRQEERMMHQAYHDPLTDLPNRVLFNDRLEHAIVQAKRTREKVGVMFVDLDGFKPVNDQNGHDVGDELLRQFAHRLQHCVRAGDTIARLAGDEFALIVPKISCDEDLIPIAQKVLQSACQPFVVNQTRLAVGASIGISLFPDHGDNPLTLLKHADQAMYAAKHAGRHTWRFFRG
ncbi:diguanylate cyclase (GGDEF)-like protein/PAS domain S-box-containing protein [Chitinivorax tropicus]|uniref:Diguanylate cyclase (GGDEF)-like protein/PAS domain S-box-containing protein n=1 Tax=Chitinivorax tropicus TaxID=714531 RepID=A0A840MX82_9PROT|nr:sensor domain-containing diguanylate cyclase [Chitinivorax tropicus]MBB5019761.1 diguanylate cyclase (GGDEF)-like protein/PAS domain S-box-containing protein [Chitinivorax tropicus]